MASLAGALSFTGRVLKWTVVTIVVLAAIVAVAGFFLVRALVEPRTDEFGTRLDEAKQVAGVDVEFFRDRGAPADLSGGPRYGSADPYLAAMDKGLLLPPAEGEAYPDEVTEVAAILGLTPEETRERAVRGLNMWNLWTGGNDRFWDYAAQNQLAGGSFDLLKLVSNYEPDERYGRSSRWRWLGLVNEPCFSESTEPDLTRPEAADSAVRPGFGLLLDRRDGDCPADPFADPTRYPGVAFGARGERLVSGGDTPAYTFGEDAGERERDRAGDGTCDIESLGQPNGTREARGIPDTMPVGSSYGWPTGVMGLRLFTNPAFDGEAADCWDPARYYSDPAYYQNKDLVRPFRVGMSCGFCHVGPNPQNAPARPEAPEFAELNSNPGAQYYWVNRVFFWDTRPRADPTTPAPNEGNLLYQLFHTNPPGTLDTSLVSSDYMNNPRTMNAVYEVAARHALVNLTGRERLTGGETNNAQVDEFDHTRALAEYVAEGPSEGDVVTMRVLKDGADSVGTLGALNRVYLNIGLFSEEWLLHFRPFAGGRKITPIEIEVARRNSVYWGATEKMSPDMAVFFLVTARADKLADAIAEEPALGDALMPEDSDVVRRGKVVFARTCAACHSSKLPDPPAGSEIFSGLCEGGGNGPQYRTCWDRYWEWTGTDAFKDAMEAIALRDDFLEDNYLSIDRRVPVDLLGTNACTALATNALEGDIWNDFSSTDYKSLPPVRPLTVRHPLSGGATEIQPLGNGRGYLRPPSLVSVWSTAPFLSNNSVGHQDYIYQDGAYRYTDPDGYGEEPGAPPLPYPPANVPADTTPAVQPAAAEGSARSVPPAASAYGAGYGVHGREPACPSANPDDPYLPCTANRLAVFEDSIRKLLTPELRVTDTEVPTLGAMYRTTAPACYRLPAGYLPDILQSTSGILHAVAGWAVDEDGDVEVGPLPAGFPINVLLNTELVPDNDEKEGWSHAWKLAKAAPTLYSAFSRLGGRCSPEELADPATQLHAERVVEETGLIDTLVGLSKCPDYEVNRGHTFGADLAEEDKAALIEFLKHL